MVTTSLTSASMATGSTEICFRWHHLARQKGSGVTSLSQASANVSDQLIRNCRLFYFETLFPKQINNSQHADLEPLSWLFISLPKTQISRYLRLNLTEILTFPDILCNFHMLFDFSVLNSNGNCTMTRICCPPYKRSRSIILLSPGHEMYVSAFECVQFGDGTKLMHMHDSCVQALCVITNTSTRIWLFEYEFTDLSNADNRQAAWTCPDRCLPRWKTKCHSLCEWWSQRRKLLNCGHNFHSDGLQQVNSNTLVHRLSHLPLESA
jgi:hypothetical protein